MAIMMLTLYRRVVLSAVMCLSIFSGLVTANLYMSTGSSTVSEGTQSSMNCYSAQLDDLNIFTRGGRVDWFRYPSLSTNMEKIARWTSSNGAEILLSDPEDSARFSLQGGLSGHSQFNQNLVIRSTSKTDQGRYFCVLYNGSGDLVAQADEIVLTVRYPPAEHFPSCTATPAGSDLILSCTSEQTTPPVTVLWYKDGAKVADGMAGFNLDVESTYHAYEDELNSQFVCQLRYDDGVDILVERTCEFNRPFVALLRMGGDQVSEGSTYHAFASSSPPMVSDIDCFLQSSSGTILNFFLEFPGYSEVTVGPVAPADNGTDLVCRAKNVFGWGEARMAVYSYPDGSATGDTTLPSVVTNYTPSDGTLLTEVWPTHPLVGRGESATFGCSYSLAIHSSSHAATAGISWKYNDIVVNAASMSRFVADGNTLTVSDISEDDDGAIVTCVATMLFDETVVVSIPSSESSTTLLFSTDPTTECAPEEPGNAALQQAQTDASILRQPAFALAVSVVAGVGWFLVILLLLIIITRNKKRNQAKVSQIKMSSQMTYRASAATNNRNNNLIDQTTNPALRALPTEPSASVVLPAGAGVNAATEPLIRSRPSTHVVLPIEPSRPEVAYQEMVGNTGLTKPRLSDTPLPILSPNGIGHGPASNGSAVRAPVTMVPAPNGGFIPQDMLASSAESKKSSQEYGENYEDLDCIRQQRVRRAAGNDYQTPISNRPDAISPEQEELLPHYANS